MSPAPDIDAVVVGYRYSLAISHTIFAALIGATASKREYPASLNAKVNGHSS
jgi:hypothetical protein